MTTIIKLRRDTAANWTIANPILAAGEPGLETDTLRVKYGDGSTTWANLSYQAVANATFATTAAVANSVAVANVAGIGNIATINLDGNASNVLRGDGTFGADQTNYGNADVANYLPTYTGNLAGDYITLTHDVNANVITANFLYGDGSNITNLPVGNIASININGNANTVLYGNGAFAAVAGGGNASLPLANGTSNFDIASANGNASITVNANSTWTFTNIGTIELANGNGYIQSLPNSAGDLSGLSTLILSPDDTTGDDRYLIVDPTGPNHVHIRPGGNINNSNAELYLGGEQNYVRISDSSSLVRMQNETTQFINSYSFTTSSGYSSAAWQDDGIGGYQVIINDPIANVYDAVVGLNQYSFIEVNDGANNYTLTATGSSSTPGGGPFTFAVNEAPPSSPTALDSIYIELNQLRTNYAEVSGLDFTVSVWDDIRLTGSDYVALRNRSNSNPVTIVSDWDGNEYAWQFHANAEMEIPGSVRFPTLVIARGDTSGGTLVGQTLKFSDSTIEALITTPDGDANNNSSQRLVINPGKGADGTTGEGGDIYLWAGRGGDIGGSGGDIKIRGGYGPNTGAGGYVRMEGGDSFDTGPAGYIDIIGGTGGNTNGGYIQIQGGYGGGGNGGAISIVGGISGAGPSASGNVTIASGPTTWDFKNDGNLTIANSLTIAGLTNTLGSNTSLIQSTDQLPLGILATGGNSAIASVWVEDFANVMSSNIAAIYCNPLPDSRMVRLAAGNNGGTMYFLDFENNGNLKFSGNSVIQSAANNAGDGSGLSTLNLYPDNSTGDDRYLVVDPTGPNHIHIRAGGAQDASNTLLFLGGEQAYVQIDDTVHEVQIGSYDNANATSYYWRFENDGQLTIPGNLVASGASPAPTLSGFSSLSAADQIVVGSNAVVLTTSGDVSATGNISAVNIGNISSTNLDGNVSNVLTGNGTFVTLPVINANTVVWSTAPISNTAAGNAGEAAYDSGGNLYVCVVANTWAKFTGTTSW
jgi:hypothetical protein